MNCNYKILIISGYDFSGTDATSITLKNIFSDMPKENIAFIKTGNYHPLNNYRHIDIYPSFAGNVSKAKVVKNLSTHRGEVAGMTGSNRKNGIKARIFNRIHTIGSSYRMLIPYKITKEVDSFIQDFNPDYIYSLLASDSIMGLCLSLSKRYDIPIIPHFMDDWQGVMFKNDALLCPARLRLVSHLKRIFKKSSFALAISEKMAKEYSGRYHCKFMPLMNCVEVNHNNEERELDKNIRIVFSGGLHLNRADSIEMLCKTLSSIQGYNFSLELFTSQDNWEKYSHQFKDYAFVKYVGFVTQEEILKKNNEADILLHVESFNEKMKKYTRLSISTKIPEYLASKRLIIAIGPVDIASIEYLKDNKAALILDNNIEENTKKLIDVLNNRELHSLYISNAYNTYKANHIQSELHKSLDTLFSNNKTKNKQNL